MTGDNRHVVAKMECFSGGVLLPSGVPVRGQAGSTLHYLVIPSPFHGEAGWCWRAQENGSRGRSHAWVVLSCRTCMTAAWWGVTARPVLSVTRVPQPAGDCHAVNSFILLISELSGSRGVNVTVVTLVPSQAPIRERSVEFKLNSFKCSAQPVFARHLFEVSDSISI